MVYPAPEKDFAFVGINYLPNIEKAQAQSFYFVDITCMNTVKLIKNMFLMFL